MATKVKVNTKGAFKKLGTIATKFVLDDIGETLEKEIIESIERGVSPVKGEGRYKKYSQSYRDALQNKSTFWKDDQGRTRAVSKGDKNTNRFIKNRNDKLYEGKRVRPVNLTVTGKLLESFKVKISKGLRVITLVFEDEKAEYHNDGTNTIPKRRMLPTGNNEQFSLRIQNQLFKAVNRALRDIIRKTR